MCQLLGMNCRKPADIRFSFTGFQARGGKTDVHADGWGIAFFEGAGARLFIDSAASAHSPVADLVRTVPIHSTNVIAHIRKATRGAVALANTHPFQRELWGRYWVFAHNGTLHDFHPALEGRFRPVGETDSELAFCWILQNLHARFGDQAPDETRLLACLRELAIAISRHGAFNFLLSNGDSLYAHCSTRLSCLVRRAPFARARLKDADVEVDFAELNSSDDRIALVATDPLTLDEAWQAIPPGSLWRLRDGEVETRLATAAPALREERKDAAPAVSGAAGFAFG